jgi:phosphoesterase RecJ-like protein
MALDWTVLVDVVAKAQRLLLVTHMRPDGDGIGSQIALALTLRDLGKEALIVIPSPMPQRYRFLDPAGEIIQYMPPGDALKGCDAIIIMDTGAWNQLGRFADFMKAHAVPKLVIDHHLTQDDLGAARLVDTTAEATGRLTYEAIRALGGRLTPAAAAALFTAIAMDTGWFRHSNTTARTFELAGILVEAGARPEELYRELFENNSLGRQKLMGRVLDRLTTTAQGLLAYSSIIMADYASTGALPPDSEDLVNLTLSVKGVEAGLLFMEQPAGGVKISFRSKNKLDVRRLAEQFGGGGHAAAAGAIVHGDLATVQAKVLAAVIQSMDPEVRG